ncbi:hypothetical protein CK224_29065 [Mesorhizobium sp. WSM3862]|nr:hypothetical protein CK224_29065 [Mesorhizobium sp. WSM3862]
MCAPTIKKFECRSAFDIGSQAERSITGWPPRQHFPLFEAAPSAVSESGRPVMYKASPEKVGLVFRDP